MTWAIDEGDVPDELHAVSTTWPFARWIVFFRGWVGAITTWSRAGFVGAFKDLHSRLIKSVIYKGVCRTYFGIGVTELDGDVPYELILESNSHDTRYCFYDR